MVRSANINPSTTEKLDAAYCSEVQPRDKAIDKLVMTKNRKDMIKALLVRSPTDSEAVADADN